MWRPLIRAGFFTALACSSELPPPGPGFPADERSIRLFDGAGVAALEPFYGSRTPFGLLAYLRVAPPIP